MPVAIDEDDVMRRAGAAWARECEVPTYPSNDSGVVEHGGKSYVVLRNINGILKVYRIRNDGMLKGLRRWPQALEDY